MPVTSKTRRATKAASGDSSRNGVSASTSSSIRSRARLPRPVPLDVLLAASREGLAVLGAQLAEPVEHGGAVRGVFGTRGVEPGGQDGHACTSGASVVSSRVTRNREVPDAATPPPPWPADQAGLGGDAFAEEAADDEVQRAEVRQDVPYDGQLGGFRAAVPGSVRRQHVGRQRQASSVRTQMPMLASPPL